LKNIIVKGFPRWEKVIIYYLHKSGYNANELNVGREAPGILKQFIVTRFLYIYLSKKWFKADYLFLVGVITPVFIKMALLFKKKVICHWIGSDVLKLKAFSKKELALFKNNKIKHFAIANHLIDELKEYGINAELLIITSGNVIPKEIPPLPKEHAVLTYWSPLRRKFYGGDIVDKLAMDFPNLKFYILGSDGKGETQLSNLIYLDKVDNIEEVFAKTSILLRLTEHDGLPSMVLEMLARGRWVIFSHKFANTNYAKKNIELNEEIIGLLNTHSLNERGIGFIISEYNYYKLSIDFKKRIVMYIKSNIVK